MSGAKSYAARAAAAFDEAIAHAKAGQGHKKRATHCKAILQSDDPVKVVECLETLDHDIAMTCTSTVSYRSIKKVGISWNIEANVNAPKSEQQYEKQRILDFPNSSWGRYKQFADARTYNDLLIKLINKKTAVDDYTPCVKETITDYTSVVSMLNQGRYAGLVKRCVKKIEGRDHRLIRACVKRYREMIGEPVETDRNE